MISKHKFKANIFTSAWSAWTYLTIFIVIFHIDAIDSKGQGRKYEREISSGGRNNHAITKYFSENAENINNEMQLPRNGGSHGGHGRGGGHRRGRRKKHDTVAHHLDDSNDNGLFLWISEQQLKMLSAMFYSQANPQGRLYAIENGQVSSYIRDINMYTYLIIPSEVNYVNFTWKAGRRKYFYHFDSLTTLDDSILKAPTVSIKIKGRIPKEEQNFSVFLPCNANKSGTAMFNIGLSIRHRRDKQLPGTPLRMSFKKECAHRGVYDSLDASNPTRLTTAQGPDPECSLKCGNNGFCNQNKICQCHAGYTGEYCQTALCLPQCLNGGNCTAPSVCTCPPGYQGTACEGGICENKCLNGGKCIQKDKCQCSNGYYGLRCEFSKCVIPCQNNGRCIGVNVCRCPSGLGGDHCEIGFKQKTNCKRPCKHGFCTRKKTCKCDDGFYGRFCNRKVKKHRRNPR